CVDGKHLDPCRCELECKGKPVKTLAELGDSCSVRGGQLELGPCATRPIDEQPDRLDSSEAFDVEDARVGKTECGNVSDAFFAELERCTSRHEDLQLRRTGQQLGDDRRR